MIFRRRSIYLRVLILIPVTWLMVTLLFAYNDNKSKNDEQSHPHQDQLSAIDDPKLVFKNSFLPNADVAHVKRNKKYSKSQVSVFQMFSCLINALKCDLMNALNCDLMNSK